MSRVRLLTDFRQDLSFEGLDKTKWGRRSGSYALDLVLAETLCSLAQLAPYTHSYTTGAAQSLGILSPNPSPKLELLRMSPRLVT
jgi:hypothetical protein